MKHLLLFLLLTLPLSAMSGPEHLSLWNIVSSLPINKGGFGSELSKTDRKLLHRFIDMRYDHSPMDKRHLPSHNARLMGRIFNDYWNPKAVRNAVALHAVADMYNSHRSDLPHKAGVNGHAYTAKRGKEAEKIIKALKKGLPVRYPKWAMKEGGRFKYDKAVIHSLKEQASQIIWLKKITGVLKAAPYIYYSTQAGRICYLYGIDRELAEEEALYFLTGLVSGSAIFHSSAKLLTVGSSTIASFGVGGAIFTIVLPTALTAAGVYALEQYLKSQKVDSFEDLAELMAGIPSIVKEFYDTGSRKTRKQMRDLYRGYKSFKRKSGKQWDKIQKGWDDLAESTTEFLEQGDEKWDDLKKSTEQLIREVERAIQ